MKQICECEHDAHQVLVHFDGEEAHGYHEPQDGKNHQFETPFGTFILCDDCWTRGHQENPDAIRQLKWLPPRGK